MSKNAFELAADGWVQLTPCGEYPHRGAGVTQVIDRKACDAMVADFDGRKADENFPGVLVDFDHFSLDTDKPSEAAGWVTDLEARDDGLWARVRWSDSGLAAVQGGRFRLVSPVFPAPDACEDLGGGRIRPLALVSVALTNEPNIRGGRPLSNRQLGVRSEELGVGGDGIVNRETSGDGPGSTEGKGPVGKQLPGDVLSGPGAKKFMWLLGDPPKGPHCGDCVSRNGQAKTLLEWLRMPAPKCHCYCRLAEVGKDVPEGYDPTAATLNLGNRWSDAARASARESRKANGWGGGWSDAARAAALAVRREKAAARSALGGTYADGQPVIRDLTDLPEPSARTSISDASDMDARQAQYAQAFRSWLDNVDGVAGSIEAFNELVASAGGAAAAVAGASAPAGAASRAYGVGVGRTGEAQARRGALSRLADGVRSLLGKSDDATEMPANESAKERFASRRKVEREALVAAIAKVRGILSEKESTDLNGLNASILRGYLRDIGGNPDEVAPRYRLVKSDLADAGGGTEFARLKAQYGVDPHTIRTPVKYAPKATAADVRGEFADYLYETLGGRGGSVDKNMSELRDLQRQAGRAVAKAKDGVRAAQAAQTSARAQYGEASPEYAKAQKEAGEAVWDLEHVTRSEAGISAELAGLTRGVREYLRQADEGSPFDWGPEDRDYNRLLEEARKKYGLPLGNRWKYGWGDAARAASMAVRKAKALARKADDAIREFLTGDLVQGKSAGKEKGEPAADVKPVKTFEPHLNADGDLVVDEWLTIMKGTKPEKVGEILRKYQSGRYLDRVIETDQRIRAAAVRKAAENKELGGTPAQREQAWRDVLSSWTSGRQGEPDSAKALLAVGAEKAKKRKGAKKMKNRVICAGLIGNRWSDSARAAARASRKANGNYGGWSDAARAAALAVRREKAAARSASYGGASYGGTYADGQPVIRDLADIGSDYTGGTYITDAGPVEERQSQYEEAFRQWWSGVDASADNIMKFHEYVAALGGAAAAAAGAYNPAGAASGAFGARYGGQKPVYDQSGNVVGWAKSGGRPAAARRSGKTGGGYGSDPLNGPETADDLALRESYGSHLEGIRQGYEAEMAAKGLDPQGYPLTQKSPASGGGLSAGAARDAARALGVLHGAYGVGDDLVDIPEALRGDYELGRAEGAKGYEYGVVPPKDRAAVLRGAQAYLAGALGEDDGYSPDHLNDRYNLSDWDSAASWATRNQGKSAVYDPRTPDTRGQYSPASLMRTALGWLKDAKARGDSGEANAALSYMSDLLVSVASDRKAAVEAARGGPDEGGDGEADEDTPETDSAMPEYDEDGNEVGGSPFYEDSIADLNTPQPWELIQELKRRARLGNRCRRLRRRNKRQGCSTASNRWYVHHGWPDSARAASIAARRAKSAARKAAALADLQAKRREARDRRGRPISEIWDKDGILASGGSEGSGVPSWAKVSNPLGLRWNADGSFASGGLDQSGGRLSDKPVSISAPSKPVGFSVPESRAVYYFNGAWYGADGSRIASAAPAPKKGAVYQNGYWYDAATGRTLGRSGLI